MHILIVTDQNVHSLGGAQVSIRLQRKYLERAGHTVSIAASTKLDQSEAAPNTSAPRGEETHQRGLDIDLPAIPLTRDRAYSATWPGRRATTAIKRALAAPGVPRVDIVHVQGDFWGALIGYRIARLLNAPVVHTQHNNLDVGTRAVTRLAGALFGVLNLARVLVLGPAPRVRGVRRPSSGAWRYLAALASEAHAVTAPSRHFARQLEHEGVAQHVSVVPSGIDDDLLAELNRGSEPREDARVRLIWVGRMSAEKRPIELIEAFAQVFATRQHEVTLTLVGDGQLRGALQCRAAQLGVGDSVRFTGPLEYSEALAEIGRADALVQTSVGFETQGMTPYEAAALGTPTVFADPNIAHEVAAEISAAGIASGDVWQAPNESVEGLGAALTQAVHSLRESPSRIPSAAADRFRQSQRTTEMIEVYEAVLRR